MAAQNASSSSSTASWSCNTWGHRASAVSSISGSINYTGVGNVAW
eukprot:CAMPEP_0171095374 /NCGR_PEP_ID=MMETSP0766_2-20121228/43135_1 /TAXON_ID=439317 /ORGANISM="Gambierdiscus australes, Strain CAWD 149" /LENGTH=44 /DNA_ID= /DNA_START= /DNA_END= /DNA_ORIENTATION=